MPIAVVDSIHILSEFFDRYQAVRDRRKTLEQVMGHLFMPMLYTSLTSSVGFASLALTPIPPVQVFGLFVAVGIMMAWFVTIVFIPAYVMLMKEKSLESFGVSKTSVVGEGGGPFLGRVLRRFGTMTYTGSKAIIVITVLVAGVAAYGISRIEINDNPVKWFHKSHDIRVADRVLNSHFGGTYEAYLILENAEADLNPAVAAGLVISGLEDVLGGEPDVFSKASLLVEANAAQSGDLQTFMGNLSEAFEEEMDAAPDATYEAWGDAVDVVEQVRNRDQVFKRPDVLEYIEALQRHLVEAGVAGKSNSVTDVVKKVHLELFEADPAYYRVPDTVGAVAQCLISYQNSHKPDDLWHLVTPDYRMANVWLQLKNGDNQYMEATIAEVDAYFKENPPPVALSHQWAGLT
jgi:predicted RND superfamily exporter protein